jgi:geranylgeranylglycerol-phosphate geranylgeranyltransferase
MIALAVFSAAFVGAGGGIISSLTPVSLAVLAAFFFGCGGNVVNDYLDLEGDRINHPDRPLPSGEVTPHAALRLAAVLFAISGVLSLLLGYISGYRVLLIVVLAFILQMSYENRLKREKVLGNLVIGAQVALAFVFGGLVVRNALATAPLAGLAFASITGREVVKDIEDLEGDVGKNTLPRMIGPRGAGVVASSLLLLAVVASLLPYTMGIFGAKYLYAIATADVIFVSSIPLIFMNAGLARRTIKIGMLVALAAFIVGRVPV